MPNSWSPSTLTTGARHGHRVRADMSAAHRLYRRLGFTRLPCRDWQPVPGLQVLAFALEFDR
jgi:hypothetical protein